MQKWEYCYLSLHRKSEIWLFKSSGEKMKLTGAESKLFEELSNLGNDGWEAVNYSIQRTSSYQDWPLHHDILFRRPIEE